MAQWNRAGGENQVRTAVRFPLRLAVSLQTAQGPIEATTENVSANGVLFVGDGLPQVGSEINFTMMMPGAIMGSTEDVCVHCAGRIVRFEQEDGVTKAGAVIDEYFLKV
jgi:hypothetical protein